MAAQSRGADRAGAAATLTRASSELRKTAGMVEDVESVVALTIALAGQAAPEQMLELQKLDAINQRIVGVADFLEALGASLPHDWKVDAPGASRSVLMAELGARLGSPEAPEAEPGPPAEMSCEMF